MLEITLSDSVFLWKRLVSDRIYDSNSAEELFKSKHCHIRVYVSNINVPRSYLFLVRLFLLSQFCFSLEPTLEELNLVAILSIHLRLSKMSMLWVLKVDVAKLRLHIVKFPQPVLDYAALDFSKELEIALDILLSHELLRVGIRDKEIGS